MPQGPQASEGAEGTTQSTADGGGDKGNGKGELIHVCRSAWLSPPAYQFYRAILCAFPEHGGPPTPAELTALALHHGVPLEETLLQFARQDLVQRDPVTGEISAAYPFSGGASAHRVQLDDNTWNATGDEGRARPAGLAAGPVALYAMCAIDALGIPLMLRRAAWIESRDAASGAPVRVRVVPTSEGPLNWSATWEPAEVVIYARPEGHEHEHDCGVSAAGTCCRVTQFFIDAGQATAWAVAHPAADGRVFTQSEALAYAAALFAGVLDRAGDGTAPSLTAAGSRRVANLSIDGTSRRATWVPHVQLLYFASCPHTPGALALVREVLRSEGLQVDVEMVAVETEETAAQQQFYGSPTIRVDGVDVAPPPDGARPALACRLYPQGDGRTALHPPATAIVDALHRARREWQEH